MVWGKYYSYNNLFELLVYILNRLNAITVMSFQNILDYLAMLVEQQIANSV